MRRLIALLLMATLASALAMAQEAEPAENAEVLPGEPTLAVAAEDIALPEGPLDLKDCVAIALAFNPRLVAANAQVREAEAALTGAKGADDPKVSLSAAHILLEEQPSLDVQGFGTFLYGSRVNWNVGLKLQIPIYTSGLTGGYKDQASAMLDAAVARAARERQTVGRDAVTAYFGVLEARAMVDVAEGQVEALSAQHNAVSRMHEVGLVPKLDPLRTEVALAGAEEMLTQARNGAEVAKANLRMVMGLPREVPFEISGEYADPDIPAELEPAIQEALENRPEVAMLSAHRRAAEAAKDIADAGDDPQLGFFAQWDFARDSRQPDTGRWSLGLGLEWNIFDGDEASSGEDQAAAQIDRIQAEAQALRDGITLQTTQAFLDLQAARDRVRTMEAAVESADEAVELAAVGYANEFTPLTDLLAAEAERTKARNDYVIALNDLRVAMAELLYAMGR
jgi:outer membrane protein TolC